MNEATLKSLEAAGFDVKATVERFAGDSSLYERFLKTFPQDENFGFIGSSLEAGDIEGAFTAAHTLKGLSGNLGLTRLYESCSKTVEFLRSKDAHGAEQSYGELKAAYDEACGIIAKLSD